MKRWSSNLFFNAAAALLCASMPCVQATAQTATPSAPLKKPTEPPAFVAPSVGDGEPTAIHVFVGHVAYLRSLAKIRRVYVANPDVLTSLTVNSRQVLLTGKAAGLSTVVLWDENDIPQTYTISVDLPATDLNTALHNALPGVEVSAEAHEGRILLNGSVSTQAIADSALHVASLFSKDVVSSIVVNAAKSRQVRLHVSIVEVDRSRLSQLGVNLFNPGGTGSTIGAGTTGQFNSNVSLSQGSSGGGTGGYQIGGQTLTVSDPLNFLLYSATANLGVTVRDLENKQVLQILAEPTITTVSGQKASFVSGGEFPFPIVQGGAGGQTSITIQFRSYGVKLEFLPDVQADGSIALKVQPEVSALDYANAVSISGYTIPALSTRRAETQVVLQSGQSFAITGLLDKRTTDILSRTPGITKIPLFGQLFKAKSINLSTSELMVIVTPIVVDPLHETPTPTPPPPVVPYLNPKSFDKGLPGQYEHRH